MQKNLLSRYKRGSISSLSPQPRHPYPMSSAQMAFLSARAQILPPLASPSQNKASPNQIITTEQVPLADTDFAFMIAPDDMTKDHIDLDLPDLPTIPPPEDSQFLSVFTQSVALCSTMCDFSTASRDKTAKERKIATLSRLLALTVTDDSLSKLQPNQIDALLNMCFLHIFRTRKPVNAKYLFSDDMVPLTEPSIIHLDQVYQIALNLMKFDPSNHLFDNAFITKIYSAFDTPDIKERSYLGLMASIFFNTRPGLIPEAKESLAAILGDYLDGTQSPHVCIPALAVIISIVSPSPMEHSDYFVSSILPFLSAPHFSFCYQPMQQIIEIFLNANRFLALPTAKSLLKHWPLTRSIKQAQFLQLLTLSLSKLKLKEFKEVRKQAFQLYASCCTSTNTIIVDAAAGVWRKLEIEPLITDSANVIFPIVYPKVVSAMSTHWNSTVVEVLNMILEAMSRIDSFVFQELARNKAPVAETDGKDLVRTWAMVSRAAKQRDSGLDLAQKLAEIQKVFVPTNTACANMAPLYMINGIRPNGKDSSQKKIIRR